MLFCKNVHFIRILLTFIILVNTNLTLVHSAYFTDQEVKQVHQYQKTYFKLDKRKYSSNYIKDKSNLAKYRKNSLASINYYRSLFNLPNITFIKKDNNEALQAANILASIKANPYQELHGLNSIIKPDDISEDKWNLAKNITDSSNLDFNIGKTSSFKTANNFLSDKYNLTGHDTGHRAWLLNPFFKISGFGISSNKYNYSVLKVIHSNDIQSSNQIISVPYPAENLFPIEEATGNNNYWSLYIFGKTYNNSPKIKITDLDSGIKTAGKNIRNYSKYNFGHFDTIITYSKGKTKLIPGHEYEINIGNIYSYKFKLFNEKTKSLVKN